MSSHTVEDNNTDGNQDEESSLRASKKKKLFCAKEFRNNLLSNEKLAALEKFLDLCNESDGENYVFQYLENGGNCLELFQLLETSTEVPASLTLQIVNHVLLQIVSNYPQHHSSAYESCRYFLNTHIALVNKMLSLASTSTERKVLLKLLTVIVTFSRNLAKDVLLHVNFNPTNLEMLSKQTGEKDSVRNVFIHFLIAFLVEGEYPTISILLEKKGLLTSIVNGLQFDSSETVCMVMTTFKKNILENTFVSKTAKMNIFSTPVVKDIVNLYNWKGLEGFNSKRKQQMVVVDEYEKSQVNESVHEFLLVLCTSHKFGVIFRDRQLGLGKRTHNALMYTVLESLERPWEHSYAGELVTKICGACPDLVKTMWANLKGFLEPRPTTRWLNAMKYAIELVQQLDPTGIEFCVQELSAQQLAQIIQFLVAPTPIIKTIIPENNIFEKPAIKHHILLVLVEFLKAVKKFLLSAKNCLKLQDYQILKNLLNEHINRNFLDAQNILCDWSKSDDEETLGSYSVLNRLEVIFELFDLYEEICPQLLESLSVVNFKDFLNEIQAVSDESSVMLLLIRAVKLFVGFEPSIFAPKQKLFAIIVPMILGFYFDTKDLSAKSTLNLLFKNTGIFEGCLEEIDIWIDAILYSRSYDINTGHSIVNIFKEVCDGFDYHLTGISKLLKGSENQIENQNFQDILESLESESVGDSSTGFAIRHQDLSPLLLAAFRYFLEHVEESKNCKSYFNCVLVNLLHFQTSTVLVTNIILNDQYRRVTSKHILNYIENWCCEMNPVILLKSKVTLAEAFSVSFLEGDINEFFETHNEDLNIYPGLLKNCLHQSLFYFCNLSIEKLAKIHLDNCNKVIQFLISKGGLEDVMKKIFGHPILLHRFSPVHLNKSLSTVFLMNIVKEFQNLNLHKELNYCLKPFRIKLVNSLKRVFKSSHKKGSKVVSLLEVIELFGFEYQHCLDTLNFCSELPLNDLKSEYLSFYYNIVTYSLKKFIEQIVDYQPLNDQIVLCVAQMLTFLNKNQEQFDTSSCATMFKEYLDIFPHSLEIIEPDLFESILHRNEFCKENSLLAGLLLKKRKDFVKIFVQTLSNISSKKGLMLSLLQAAIFIKVDEDILKNAYQSFEPSIVKGLQKPQKAGQYFEMYHEVLAVLIKKFLSEDVCKSFVEKVHKFEVSEPFHVEMLITIFNKIIFYKQEQISESYVNNAILTLVHITNLLFKRKSKFDEDGAKLNEIVTYTIEFFEDNLINKSAEISFRAVCENDSFQTYCKFCLKFGLSGNALLIKLIRCLVEFVNFEENETQLLLDMAGSHSEFLNVILGEQQNECKIELLHLVLVLCQRWPSLMQRNHVPVLLAAYNAMVRPADRIILTLLQSYEKAAARTNFYDFKPFLWGTAAATHYSVRQDIQKALWRQPKMGDILDILKKDFIFNTIINYPLESGLTATKEMSVLQKQNVYDLAFFLPLFSSLLAPENEAATLKFVKSGALSLTIVALSSNNRELRMAACHVLARLHYHIEARPGGKDKLLWLRCVEAVCRGTAILEDFKLNNFAAIFWAKMVLILTQPLHPLYVPMAQYLGARSSPDLSNVPELYTFLHSSDVNFKEMQTFILEILRDGLRRDSDFLVALHSMAFKLIMELFSSCIADLDTKILILSVFENACRLNMGRQLLCSSYGLISWLYEIVNIECNNKRILPIVIRILRTILQDGNDAKFSVDYNMLSLIIQNIIDKDLILNFQKEDLSHLLHVINAIFDVNKEFLTE
ncbi:hypothetical protein ILUMI_03556, partial [Ignelater luminosus]